MDLSENFIPIIRNGLNVSSPNDDSWLGEIAIYEDEFPSFENKDIALIGIVPEKSNTDNNIIRSFLYSYTNKEYGKKVVDLGNFLLPQKDEQSTKKLAYVLSELIEQGICPIILGHSQEATYALYLAFEYLKKYINMVNIDSVIDFQIDENKKMDDQGYLYRLLLKDPSYLFNLSNLAFQTHLTDNSVLKLMESHHFDLYRLGVLQENIREMEPVIRTADLLSFDISAIRQSDSPGTNHPSPNGLYAEEACKISRYAGLSDYLSCIGFFEYNSDFDNNYQSARLIAQMIWYFVDGFLHRDNEIKVKNNQNFVKYITTDDNNTHQIHFYKSKKTNRWWMEVPVTDKSRNYENMEIIPCSYQDYQLATKGDIPERWWKALQKLSN